MATDDRSSVHVTAWAATVTLTVSSSEMVVCSWDSKVHTSRLLYPIGGSLPRSTATKVTLAVIASCLSNLAVFSSGHWLVLSCDPVDRPGRRTDQTIAVWHCQYPLR